MVVQDTVETFMQRYEQGGFSDRYRADVNDKVFSDEAILIQIELDRADRTAGKCVELHYNGISARVAVFI